MSRIDAPVWVSNAFTINVLASHSSDKVSNEWMLTGGISDKALKFNLGYIVFYPTSNLNRILMECDQAEAWLQSPWKWTKQYRIQRTLRRLESLSLNSTNPFTNTKPKIFLFLELWDTPKTTQMPEERRDWKMCPMWTQEKAILCSFWTANIRLVSDG